MLKPFVKGKTRVRTPPVFLDTIPYMRYINRRPVYIEDADRRKNAERNFFSKNKFPEGLLVDNTLCGNIGRLQPRAPALEIAC